MRKGAVIFWMLANLTFQMSPVRAQSAQDIIDEYERHVYKTVTTEQDLTDIQQALVAKVTDYLNSSTLGIRYVCDALGQPYEMFKNKCRESITNIIIGWGYVPSQKIINSFLISMIVQLEAAVKIYGTVWHQSNSVQIGEQIKDLFIKRIADQQHIKQDESSLKEIVKEGLSGMNRSQGRHEKKVHLSSKGTSQEWTAYGLIFVGAGIGLLLGINGVAAYCFSDKVEQRVIERLDTASKKIQGSLQDQASLTAQSLGSLENNFESMRGFVSAAHVQQQQAFKAMACENEESREFFQHQVNTLKEETRECFQPQINALNEDLMQTTQVVGKGFNLMHEKIMEVSEKFMAVNQKLRILTEKTELLATTQKSETAALQKKVNQVQQQAATAHKETCKKVEVVEKTTREIQRGMSRLGNNHEKLAKQVMSLEQAHKILQAQHQFQQELIALLKLDQSKQWQELITNSRQVAGVQAHVDQENRSKAERLMQEEVEQRKRQDPSFDERVRDLGKKIADKTGLSTLYEAGELVFDVGKLAVEFIRT